MKRRKDCFFGLHFDFHATRETKGIGAFFDAEKLEEILQRVRPDFVQCDTKGHPGISSYPTKVGNPAPDMRGDILRQWRSITEKYGVGLYAHYSGVWDTEAIAKHPDWAAVKADGTASKDMTSVFGPYVDELLIPQLKELALDYGLNGAWIDGDCWATIPDYGPRAAAEYQKKYGRLPEKPDEEGHGRFNAFCREQFYRYAEHYIKAVKAAAPDFEITSNWLNTAQAPDEFVCTDYISGDLESEDSAYSARFNGRLIADYERPWDIMAWGFRLSNGIFYMKTPAQLCQEAAAILSVGGGVQIYEIQHPNHVMKEGWAVGDLAAVAQFCRDRQPYCQYAKSIHDVGVIHSNAAFYHINDQWFGWGGEYTQDTRGILNALLDSQASAEIVLTHSALRHDLSEYSALFVGNVGVIEDELKEKLLAYAAQGGQLFLLGANTAELFAADTGISIQKKVTSDPVLRVKGGEMRAEVHQAYAVLSAQNIVSEMQTLESVDKLLYPAEDIPACVATLYGRGEIVTVPFNFGLAYWRENTAALGEFAAELVRRIRGRKVTAEGSRYVTVNLMQKEGAEYIHLLNMAGPHRSVSVKTFAEIPPLHDIKVSYRRAEKPVSAVMYPEGKPLAFTYKNGTVNMQVEELDIHSVIEIR